MPVPAITEPMTTNDHDRQPSPKARTAPNSLKRPGFDRGSLVMSRRQ
jgi:hypothetical protein